jgi:aminoglycoside phosphotransferase
MSLTPLFKTMKIGGLSHPEAWSRVLVYTKSLLEDIKSVRALSAEKDCAAMIWGSFRTAELLKEYTRLRWVQHPQVSSILALTSMQREGKALTDAVATMGTQATTLKKHTTDLKQVQDDYKQLKRSNPSLK